MAGNQRLWASTSPIDNSLKRRTLLKVYANQGEYILLGSSAVGNGKSDISIYSNVSGRIGNETLGSLSFMCSTQKINTKNAAQGHISSRDQELAGPDTITNPVTATPGNKVSYNGTSGYVPCYYQAPSDGIYYVVFYGPDGGNSDINFSPDGVLNFANNSDQNTNVAAWDVTVRKSLTDTNDLNGRLFADYLSLFTGGNNRPVNSTFYIVTKDGYRYKTDLNGLDPNGFIIYGNDIGYYDSDGKTPLYHDVLGDNGINSGSLGKLKGGTNLALPTHQIFFSDPSSGQADQAIGAAGIPLMPTTPLISKPSFTGNKGPSVSYQNNGGTFSFQSNVPGSYQIIISRDGKDYTSDNLNNRVLQGTMTAANTVLWDGKDGNGKFFPVGTNYPVKIIGRNGEYHFPLIDAENSLKGGPIFTVLNGQNANSTIGIYDDRDYTTISNVNVPIYSCGANGDGGGHPSKSNSDLVTGFNTNSMVRAYGFGGDPLKINTNTPCTGAFGDAKGLDLWTFTASTPASTYVDIIANGPDLTITKSHTGNFIAGKTGLYSITVSNSNIGNGATNGAVTVSDTLPTGLTPTTASGTGWSCTISGQTVTCTRSDALAINSSYPPISVNVNVATNAPANVTNTATVSGGAEDKSNAGNNTANDPTTITPVYGISGTLYKDSNTDKNFNNGEPTLPANITVKLINPTDNSVITTTTTDVSGKYTFTGLINNNYQIQVDTSNTNIPAGYTLETPNNVAVTVNGNDTTNINFGFIPPTGKPKLLLVKRITAINGVAINSYVDDSNSTDDNDSKWPTPIDSGSKISSYLRGAINNTIVRPGDDIEYTIYFLSTGTQDATKVNICDPIPANTTFVPTAYKSQNITDGGIPGADKGIALALGSNTPTVYLTNVIDPPDRGQFYTANDPKTPSYCGSNTNGAVEVNVTRNSDLPNLPLATTPGNPTNSYGFIRFHVKVN